MLSEKARPAKISRRANAPGSPRRADRAGRPTPARSAGAARPDAPGAGGERSNIDQAHEQPDQAVISVPAIIARTPRWSTLEGDTGSASAAREAEDIALDN